MSKKGFLGVGDIFAILLLAMVLLAFYWYFFIGGAVTKLAGGIPEENIVSTDFGVVDVKYVSLLEVIVDNPILEDQNMDISDLILWSVMNDDYAVLEKELAEIFIETEYYYHIGIFGYRNGESFNHKISRPGVNVKYVPGREAEQMHEESIIIPGYGVVSDLMLKIKIVEGVFV